MLIESGDLIPVLREAIEIPWTKRRTQILAYLFRGPVTFQTYVYDTNVGDIAPLTTYFNPEKWTVQDLNCKFGNRATIDEISAAAINSQGPNTTTTPSGGLNNLGVTATAAGAGAKAKSTSLMPRLMLIPPFFEISAPCSPSADSGISSSKDSAQTVTSSANVTSLAAVAMTSSAQEQTEGTTTAWTSASSSASQKPPPPPQPVPLYSVASLKPVAAPPSLSSVPSLKPAEAIHQHHIASKGWPHTGLPPAATLQDSALALSATATNNKAIKGSEKLNEKAFICGDVQKPTVAAAAAAATSAAAGANGNNGEVVQACSPAAHQVCSSSSELANALWKVDAFRQQQTTDLSRPSSPSLHPGSSSSCSSSRASSRPGSRCSGRAAASSFSRPESSLSNPDSLNDNRITVPPPSLSSNGLASPRPEVDPSSKRAGLPPPTRPYVYPEGLRYLFERGLGDSSAPAAATPAGFDPTQPPPLPHLPTNQPPPLSRSAAAICNVLERFMPKKQETKPQQQQQQQEQQPRFPVFSTGLKELDDVIERIGDCRPDPLAPWTNPKITQKSCQIPSTNKLPTQCEPEEIIPLFEIADSDLLCRIRDDVITESSDVTTDSKDSCPDLEAVKKTIPHHTVRLRKIPFINPELGLSSKSMPYFHDLALELELPLSKYSNFPC